MTTETIATLLNHNTGQKPAAAGPACLQSRRQSEYRPFDERRLDSRHAAAGIDVALYMKGNYSAAGTIRNVALRGIFVQTDAEFAKDAHVQLRFSLAGEEMDPHFHRIWGQVVHTADGGIGVHLDILHPDTEAGLHALLQQVPKRH